MFWHQGFLPDVGNNVSNPAQLFLTTTGQLRPVENYVLPVAFFVVVPDEQDMLTTSMFRAGLFHSVCTVRPSSPNIDVAHAW